MIEKLWIANIPAGTSDGDIVTLVEKHAPDLECFDIKRFESEGSRPAALLSMAHKSPASNLANGENAVMARLQSVDRLSRRLDGLYWNGRTLAAAKVILGVAEGCSRAARSRSAN